ncbi:MAG TPA: hypothetical protein VK165_10085 [Azonexus sp.]|nr:hypothetical protein [Azonexus sp.]
MQKHTQLFSEFADPSNSGSAGGGQITGSSPFQGGIPEKFRVTRPDGSMDIEASSLKLAEAHIHLERRLGAGEGRPLTPAGYNIAVPEGLQGEWNPAEDKTLQDFLGKAHELGFSQGQIDLALNAYHENASLMVEGGLGLTPEQCTAELRKAWPDQQEYNARVRDAHRAAMAYAGADAEALMAKHGNDPALIKALAKVGSQLGEDRSISTEVSYARPSVQSLISSEAYNNPNHPEHARVSRQVSEYYASIHKGDAR